MWSWPVWSTTTEKSQWKSVRYAGAMTRLKPGITIWTNPFSRFVYYPSPLPEQVPYSYPRLPQYVHTLAVTFHCRYIHCMPSSHHMHSFINLHSPSSSKVKCVWNVMAHAQKPDFVFRWNRRVHLNRQGHSSVDYWQLRCAHQQ